MSASEDRAALACIQEAVSEMDCTSAVSLQALQEQVCVCDPSACGGGSDSGSTYYDTGYYRR